MLPLVTIFTAIATTITASAVSPAPNTTCTSWASITDKILFKLPLLNFATHQNNKEPKRLNWTSDGCTSSPDNPFNFPFLPACQRHDFGYNNYRLQKRFTESNKLKIDDQFRKDLYAQCNHVTAEIACNALAEVYYYAVRMFGGRDQTPEKRMNQATSWEYQKLVAIYEEEVRKAQKAGDLPLLN